MVFYLVVNLARGGARVATYTCIQLILGTGEVSKQALLYANRIVGDLAYCRLLEKAIETFQWYVSMIDFAGNLFIYS